MKYLQIQILLFIFSGSIVHAQTDSLHYAWLMHQKLKPASSDSAAVIYKRYLQTQTNDAAALGGLAEVFAEKAWWAKEENEIAKWIDSAFYYADRSLQKDPKNTSALFAKATAINRQGKQFVAAKWYKKLLEIKPDYPRAINFYTTLAGGAGWYYEYWKWSRKATEQVPTNDNTWWDHALSYAYFSENATADSLWSKVLQVNPKRGAGWGEKSYLKLLHGDTKSAVELMRKATEVDSRDIHQMGLAYMLTADKQYAAALELTEKVLRKNPVATMYGASPGIILKAFLWMKLLQKDSANKLANELIQQFEKSVGKKEDESGLHRDIATLYSIIGEKNKATEHLELAFKQGIGYRYVYANPYFENLIGYKPFEKLIKKERSRVEKEKRKMRSI